jgi:hypothetical protein
MGGLMGIKDVLLIVDEGLLPKVQHHFMHLTTTMAKNILGYAFTGEVDGYHKGGKGYITRDILYVDSGREYDENELKLHRVLWGRRFADRFPGLIKEHKILQDNSHYIIMEGNDLNPGNTGDDRLLANTSTCYMLTLAHRMLKNCGIEKDEMIEGTKDVGWISESGESFRSGSLEPGNMLLRMNELALDKAYRLE